MEQLSNIDLLLKIIKERIKLADFAFLQMLFDFRGQNLFPYWLKEAAGCHPSCSFFLVCADQP